jgi:hypothetical protein
VTAPVVRRRASRRRRARSRIRRPSIRTPPAPDAAGVARRRTRAHPPGRARGDGSAAPPAGRGADAPADRAAGRDAFDDPAGKRDGGGVPVVRDVRKAAAAVARVVTQHPDKSVFPGALLLIVLGFVSIQNRMDRNDPKLALAPVFAEAELEFGPPPEPEGA